MKSRLKYACGFITCLIIEILIALFVHDNFVRPYIGDVLVVVVIYFLLRMIIDGKCKWLPIIIFVFAAGVEVSQYFNIVGLLGLSDISFFRILIGTTFDIKDIICYGVGCVILQILEILIRKKFKVSI